MNDEMVRRHEVALRQIVPAYLEGRAVGYQFGFLSGLRQRYLRLSTVGGRYAARHWDRQVLLIEAEIARLLSQGDVAAGRQGPPVEIPVPPAPEPARDTPAWLATAILLVALALPLVLGMPCLPAMGQ